jgi:hypothetical protein
MEDVLSVCTRPHDPDRPLVLWLVWMKPQNKSSDEHTYLLSLPRRVAMAALACPMPPG